jgi:hypothetical protein
VWVRVIRSPVRMRARHLSDNQVCRLLLAGGGRRRHGVAPPDYRRMEPTITRAPFSQVADQCESDQLRRYVRYRRLLADIREAARLEEARRRLEHHLTRLIT